MSEQKLSTKALHAGHDTSLGKEQELFLFINLHLMFLMILTMLQTYLHLLNQDIFTQD